MRAHAHQIRCACQVPVCQCVCQCVCECVRARACVHLCACVCHYVCANSMKIRFFDTLACARAHTQVDAFVQQQEDELIDDWDADSADADD